MKKKLIRFKTTKYILIGILSFSLTSCSVNLLNYSILADQSVKINPEGGIEVSGFYNSWARSQRKSVKIATERALKEAGIGYDILINGKIEVEYKVLYLRYRVTGTAFKSKDLINKYGQIGFEQWKEKQETEIAEE